MVWDLGIFHAHAMVGNTVVYSQRLTEGRQEEHVSEAGCKAIGSGGDCANCKGHMLSKGAALLPSS